MSSTGSTIEQSIIAKARETGASLAGIARVSALKDSPSYAVYDRRPYYREYKGVEWPKGWKSVLVWALAHPASRPSLDWWSKKVPGFTPGNHVLMDQSKKIRVWIEQELGIKALPLAYQIESGGVFLKDSAVLAGLGVFGKNNLLVTPEFGPRVRLRGIFLEADLEPTGPLPDFDPCRDCDTPCFRSCPRNAFDSGRYERDSCKLEMDKCNANGTLIEGPIMGIDEPSDTVKFCRNCEFSCPIGREAAG